MSGHKSSATFDDLENHVSSISPPSENVMLMPSTFHGNAVDSDNVDITMTDIADNLMYPMDSVQDFGFDSLEPQAREKGFRRVMSSPGDLCSLLTLPQPNQLADDSLLEMNRGVRAMSLDLSDNPPSELPGLTMNTIAEHDQFHQSLTQESMSSSHPRMHSQTIPSILPVSPSNAEPPSKQRRTVDTSFKPAPFNLVYDASPLSTTSSLSNYSTDNDQLPQHPQITNVLSSLKRSKSSPVALNTLPMSGNSVSRKHKQQHRLARKAAAARAARKKKKEYVESLENRVAQLTRRLAELEAGTSHRSIETIHRDEQVALQRSMSEKLDEIKHRDTVDGPTQQYLKRLVNSFVNNSRQRQAASAHFLSKLADLTEPTVHLKFVMWVLDQPDDFYRDEGGLWNNLMGRDVGLTDKQKTELQSLRPQIQRVRQALTQANQQLKVTRDDVAQMLHKRHRHVDEFKGSLTPDQLAKYISWVSRNEHCMQVLDSIWKKELLPK